MHSLTHLSNVAKKESKQLSIGLKKFEKELKN